MRNNKQTDEVKKALDLETEIATHTQVLSKLASERFAATPKPPVRTVVNRTYPKIEPTTKFSWKLVILVSLLCTPIGGYIYYKYAKNQQKIEIELTKNSDEYKNKCSEADKEFDKQQAEYDAVYQNEKELYDNETLPAYNKEKDAWVEQQAKKIAAATEKLTNANTELEERYQNTHIVPLQYRSIPALKYIYDIMSTSDYDVKEAIDLYDRNEQMKLDQARLNEQQQANRLANEANQLAYEQNELLDEQNEIAAKARRDANIAAAVGTVQRHNTNKTLKKFIK